MFWFVLIGLFVALFIYSRCYNNPYQLYFIFGKKGSGKSTYMVKMMIKYLKKGWYVYTDMFDVLVPGVRVINIEDLGEFVPVENSALFLDEAGILFDNRNFKNFKSDLRDFFKLQRKYRVVCYMNSQSFDVDKKIRDLTDFMFLQINVFRILSVGRRIEKRPIPVKSSAQGDSRIAEDLHFCPFWTWTWTLIPRYSKYFESFQAPYREPISYREISSDLDKLTERRSLKILNRIHHKKGKFEE